MAMTLTSPAFEQGGTIPKRHTCDGENRSPVFAWSNVPNGAQSLLLVCDDPDAPGGVFHHWAAFNIPADRTGLEGGYGPETLEKGFRQAINDFGKPGYAGPCPRKGDAPHAYHFRLSALDTVLVSAAPSASCVEVITLARPHVIEFVELVGMYGRST
jgi:Raf kinase inhibitor-like YbhB/YbcL family protein